MPGLANVSDALYTIRARLQQLAQLKAMKQTVLGETDPTLDEYAAMLRDKLARLPILEYITKEQLTAFLMGGPLPAGLPTWSEKDEQPTPSVAQQDVIDAMAMELNERQPEFRSVRPKTPAAEQPGGGAAQEIVIDGLPPQARAGDVAAG